MPSIEPQNSPFLRLPTKLHIEIMGHAASNANVKNLTQFRKEIAPLFQINQQLREIMYNYSKSIKNKIKETIFIEANCLNCLPTLQIGQEPKTAKDFTLPLPNLIKNLAYACYMSELAYSIHVMNNPDHPDYHNDTHQYRVTRHLSSNPDMPKPDYNQTMPTINPRFVKLIQEAE